MPFQIHPYFRDKELAMESAGVIQALDSVGYTVQDAAEDAGTLPEPTILVGSNWFFGGTINQPNGQTHSAG
jgi:hypothetical protein